MLIKLRDRNKKLIIKDMLDIDFDMSVENKEDRFYVCINHNYRLDEEFSTEEIAEERMEEIADIRNNLETELRQY